MYFKPLLKTLIVSGLLFLIIIVLGMKYHWIEMLKFKQHEEQTLIIPAKSDDKEVNQIINAVATQQENDEDAEFEPEIMFNENFNSSVSNLTKEQVTQQCQSLYLNLGPYQNLKTSMDDLALEIAIGDCVVSNYKETVQEIANSDNKRQTQTIKRNVELSCLNTIRRQNRNYSDIELQLLVGVCASDQLNRN